MDSGSSGPSNTTTQTSNIPEYARPYVEQMLGSAQQELFNYEDVTDPVTGQTTKSPTSLKGYTPFSQNVNDYFGGFQPLQQDAFAGAKNLAQPPKQVTPRLWPVRWVCVRSTLHMTQCRLGTNRSVASKLAST